MRPRVSFMHDWLLASAIAFAVSYVSIVLAALVVPGDAFATALRAAWIPCGAGALGVSLPVVWAARRMRVGQPWVFGATAGVAAAFLTAFWFARFLVGRLGG